MTYKRFGSTGLQVGPIGLGTVNFSWLTDEADSFAILDRAFEAGVNLIDTSDNYNAGQTEALLGRWFAQGGGRRERSVLASKCYSAPMEWGSPDPVKRTGSWVGPNQKGLSAKHIREACEASLRRLQTDYIDLYQMHHIDRAAPPEEIWQAMDRLISQGKITYVGSSNFPGWAIARFNERAAHSGRLGLVSEQGLYNLLERRAELEVLPACRVYGVGMIVWSPLAGGLLAGRSEDASGRRAFAQDGEGARAHAGRLEAFEALCRELGVAPGFLATAWLLNQPGVTSVIAGPRRRDQLSSLLGAAGLRLDDSVLQRLDEVFPACGPAPEAYAW